MRVALIAICCWSVLMAGPTAAPAVTELADDRAALVHGGCIFPCVCSGPKTCDKHSCKIDLVYNEDTGEIEIRDNCTACEFDRPDGQLCAIDSEHGFTYCADGIYSETWCGEAYDGGQCFGVWPDPPEQNECRALPGNQLIPGSHCGGTKCFAHN